ncbi:unnamed protein product [Moneuplotes crassus]|uniref:Uncharacterized protein n=1 Tax=Euplotes crassus TaxID=5936 RepID=A0AAD1UA77_EUPCR|nr:unnamed protein product [Moneuplotes crassus]
MIHSIDTQDLDDLIFSFKQCRDEAESLAADYNSLGQNQDHFEALKEFEQNFAIFEEEEVEKMNEDFTQFEEMISGYHHKLEDIRQGYKEIEEAKISIQKMEVYIVQLEKHLASLKLKYMTLEMHQKHEIRKDLIQKNYQGKIQEMKNKIDKKNENLKKMRGTLDDAFAKWNEIRKETQEQLDEKSTYLKACKKEQEQLDLQIELEEEKILELKQEIEEKEAQKHFVGKAKIKQLEELEKKKKELKDYNINLADNIEELEDKKESLELEIQNLNNQILEKVNMKKKLKDKEISERRKQSQIKDILYEKKRHMDSLEDDVTTRAKEVQELKKILSSLNQESQTLGEGTYNDNDSMDRYIAEDEAKSENSPDADTIEKQIYKYFSDFESNPHKHSVEKISEREYQVGTFSLYPVLKKGIVMLNTPERQMSLYEFYQKNLNKNIPESTGKLISEDKGNNKHFIFSGQQFELSNEVDENSRSINSQFEAPEQEDGRIEFQIDDEMNKQQKISFIESYNSDDSYDISSGSSKKKSPTQDIKDLGKSGEKEAVMAGSPLMNKKDQKAPPKSNKIPKKTKSRLNDLVMRNLQANKHF